MLCLGLTLALGLVTLGLGLAAGCRKSRKRSLCRNLYPRVSWGCLRLGLRLGPSLGLLGPPIIMSNANAVRRICNRRQEALCHMGRRQQDVVRAADTMLLQISLVS